MKSRLIQETVTYETAMEMLECGKNKVFDLCQSGDLVSIVHAGRRRIYIDSINDYSDRIRQSAFRAAESRCAV